MDEETKLNLILTEYQIVRSELNETIKSRNNLLITAISIIISILTIVITIGNLEYLSGILAILPVIYAIFYMLYLSNDTKIRIIKHGLERIRKDISKLGQTPALQSDASIIEKTELIDVILRFLWLLIAASTIVFSIISLNFIYRSQGFWAVIALLGVYTLLMWFLIILRLKSLSYLREEGIIK